MTTTYNSLSHEDFVQRVKEFNPDIEIIGNYDGINRKLLVRDRYGLLNVTANTLFKSPPTIQVAVDKTKYWMTKYNIEELHGYKYDYSISEYKGTHIKMNIICPKHGEFLQYPTNHAKGHGCWGCFTENIKGGHGGLNLNTAEIKKNEWENKEAFVYHIKIESDVESFYKIGITTQNLKKRFRNLKPYNYEVLNYVTTNLYEAVKIERECLDFIKDYSYIPSVKFDGYTECFSHTAPEVENLLIQYSSNPTQSQPNQLPL